MDARGKFCFGFSKSAAKPKLLKTSELSDEPELKRTSIEYVTAFENYIPQSNSHFPSEELVIPMKISKSNIHEQLKRKYGEVEAGDISTTQSLKLHPLNLTNNMILPTSSMEDSPVTLIKEDVSDNAAVPDADYNVIPIEHFGLALLKGMGLKESDIKRYDTDDFTTKVRLKGLGLGADPKVLKNSRESAKHPIDEGDEKMVWKLGAKCQIVYGKNKGQYGSIQGIDGDIGRVMVKVSASSQTVNVMQATVRLVSSAEFDKFGRSPNIVEVRPDGESEAVMESIDYRINGKGKQSGSETPVKRWKEDLERDNHFPTWLRKGLVVRFLDKGSRHYLQKVKILSISPTASHSYRCSCETNSGRILQNISEKELTATIPKHPGESVAVIRGQYSGEIGEFIERNDHAFRVSVFLYATRKVIFLSRDEVCRFENPH